MQSVRQDRIRNQQSMEYVFNVHNLYYLDMAWDVTNGFAVFGKRKFWSVNNIFVFCVNMVLMLDKIIISTIQTQFMLRPLFSFSDSKSHRYPHVRQHTDSPQHYCVSHCHSLARPQTYNYTYYMLLDM